MGWEEEDKSLVGRSLSLPAQLSKFVKFVEKIWEGANIENLYSVGPTSKGGLSK